MVVSTSSTTTPGRAFRNSLTVSRFTHSLRSLAPVALRSLRLLGCSMPLREKSVKVRMITYKNTRISIFVGNNIEYYLTKFLQNIEFGCFCRKKLPVFNFFVSQTVKNMLPKQKKYLQKSCFTRFCR